jgi:dienelactone hydrolase
MDLERITYTAGGRTFAGWLADGSSGRWPAPGVLVIHEGGGLGDHTRNVAARLAALGHVAFAMDLFGGEGLAMDEMRAIVRDLRADVALLRGRCAAALAVLREHACVDRERLAAIGYCFGGAAAIELARSGAPLKAVAGFHAGILPGSAADDAAMTGKVLLCHGAKDPVVPPAQILAFTAAMSAAGIDWQLHLYGGVGHSFTNPAIDALGLPGFFYHTDTDRRSWAALMDLFGETLGERPA